MDKLKNFPVWVNWKLDPKKGKIPKNPKTGGNAQTNNPATWSSYELAEKRFEKQGNYYDGIGFVFTDGLAGIDIDHAIGNPELEAAAADIIELMQSYTEYSPSREGYHIIFRVDLAKLPKDYPTQYYQNKTQSGGFECYVSGKTRKYFTFTGEKINDWDIEDRTDQLLSFLEKYMKKNPPKHANAIEDSRVRNVFDSTFDVLSIARKAKNGNKFMTLFDVGNIDTYRGDDSAADIALCNILAFYCQGDFNEIDKYFRQSALMREKWEREDYRNATINKAVELCNGKFYKPKTSKPRKERQPVKLEQHTGASYINPFETPETRQRYDWNDIGVGNLFADTYKNLCRYVPEAKAWYVYDGRVWRMDMGGVTVAQYAKDLIYYMLDCRKFIDNDQVSEAWIDFVAKRMKKPARDTMLADAASVYPVSILEFDKNPHIYNCQNCTLDLRSFTMHKHRASDFLSKISNVTFDKNAKCDRWESFINEIMRGDAETAKFLQKALGYTLIGDTSEECFFILYGSTTRNGKGTTMETTLHIMGDYGRTAQPETIAQKQTANGGGPSEDIARLKGARFVNMSEPDKGLRLNSALVKQITGGDTVTARFLHQNSFEYRPEYTLFINTNHLPRVTDDSIFASGRVKLIPFERHFKENEQDKGLKTFFKQPENMSGIFNWFIEGLKLMQVEGLQQPSAVMSATSQYREESDTIGLFVRECMVEVKHEKTLIKDVYAEYEKWCEGYGYNSLNKNNLTTELRRKGMTIKNADKNKVYLFGYGIIVSDSDLPQEWRK